MGDNHSSRIWCWGKGSLRPTAKYQAEIHFWVTTSVNTCSSTIIIIPWSRFWNQSPCDKRQKMTWVSISSPFLEQEMNRCSPQRAVPTCHSCFTSPPPPLTQPFWYQNSQALPVPLHPGVSTAQCDSRYEITGRYLPEIMEVPRPQIGPHWREHYDFQKLPTQGLLHRAVTTKEENPIQKSLWR